MLIVGIDFETTGLDPENDRIIEIGGVLWDTETNSPIIIQNYLIGISGITEDTTSITGITQQHLDSFGYPAKQVLSRMNSLMNMGEYIVAHNGRSFDKKFYEKECERNELVKVDKPWIDTLEDVVYPSHVQSKKLKYLAADHGFVNPFSHRAVFDVLSMLKILSHYDIEKVIEYSKMPTIRIVAMVAFEHKDVVKANGFLWEPTKKIWYKDIKADRLEEETQKANGVYRIKEV